MKQTYVGSMLGILLVLAGCRGTGSGTTAGVSMVLVPSAAATAPPPQTRFVAGGLALPDPGPAASVPPSAAPSAAASPVPSAAPSLWTGGIFAVTVPDTWRRRIDGDAQVMLALEGPAARGKFVVRAQPTEGSNEAAQQAAARQEAGDGLVSFSVAALDELRGFLAISNRHTPDGPRYFRVWGFMYRHHFVSLTASWDKLDPAAPEVQRDVDALLKGWKWL